MTGPRLRVQVPDNIFSAANVDDERKQLRYLMRQEALFRLAVRGFSAVAAARQLRANGLSCSDAAAQMIYRKPEFRKRVLRAVDYAHAEGDAEFIERKRSLAEQIEEKSQEAFDTLISMLTDENTSESVRAKIAMDLLNRNEETSTISKQEKTLKITTEVLDAAVGASNTMDMFIKTRPAALTVLPKRAS